MILAKMYSHFKSLTKHQLDNLSQQLNIGKMTNLAKRSRLSGLLQEKVSNQKDR